MAARRPGESTIGLTLALQVISLGAIHSQFLLEALTATKGPDMDRNPDMVIALQDPRQSMAASIVNLTGLSACCS